MKGRQFRLDKKYSTKGRRRTVMKHAKYHFRELLLSESKVTLKKDGEISEDNLQDVKKVESYFEKMVG